MGFLDKNLGSRIGSPLKTSNGITGIFNLNNALILKTQNNWHREIIQDGLVLNLDKNKTNSYLLSIPSSDLPIDWTIGSGGTSLYPQNGDGNSRKLDIDPFGNTNIIWDVSNQDSGSDDDGGWNSSSIAVDPAYIYRFSVWVRRKVVGNGSFYLGLYDYNSSGVNINALNRANLEASGNPYFYATGWPGRASDWYLAVGHVWPVGSSVGALHPDSGFYDMSGNKITTGADWVWNSGTARTMHRSYLYYSTDTSTNQQWFNPRIDKINGSQPSIYQLLNGTSERQWYDLSSLRNHALLYSGQAAYIPFNSTLNFNMGQTIEIWLKPNEADSLRRNPYNQAYGGGGTMTHEPDNTINYFWGTSGIDAQTYSGISSSFTVVNGEMACICITRNSSTVQWYKNGVAYNSATNSYGTGVVTGTLPIKIGYGYTERYCGGIYSIRVWNKGLTATEVSQNFNAVKSYYGM